jgi:hypothetical protein
MTAALVYLWPRWRRDVVAAPPPRPVPRSALAATALVGAVVPLALVLALRPQPAGYLTARDNVHAVEAPISDALAATASGGRLRWRAVDGHGSRIHYVVLRAERGTDGCTAPAAGAPQCLLAATSIGTTRGISFAVPRAPATYRIALAANYLEEQNGSDVMLLGPPVTVR